MSVPYGPAGAPRKTLLLAVASARVGADIRVRVQDGAAQLPHQPNLLNAPLPRLKRRPVASSAIDDRCHAASGRAAHGQVLVHLAAELAEVANNCFAVDVTALVHVAIDRAVRPTEDAALYVWGKV